MSLLREFRPALSFLGKFLAFYFFGNILYGVYVESYDSRADPATGFITAQTSSVLRAIGYETTHEEVLGVPKIALTNAGATVLYVFEGCNGINVMIVFIAFLIAYGGRLRNFLIFIPCGIFLIHLFNLLRVSLLFYLAENNFTQFYYYHKYFFTATLYFVVFALWYVWVVRFNEKRSIKVTA